MKRPLLIAASFWLGCAYSSDSLPDGSEGPKTPKPAAAALTCIDTQSDPQNCGACGATCVIPHAGAACDQGQCAVAECEAGYFDVDGSVDNGCEVKSECVANTACTTSCGSDGVTQCQGPDAVCIPPAEVCNGRDDNCDGWVDEGAIPGCRVGVIRAAGPEGHDYTTGTALPDNTIEANPYFFIYAQDVGGLIPFARCVKFGPSGGYFGHFITSHNACEGIGHFAPGALGFMSPTPLPGTVPLLRLLSPDGLNHFYTISVAERDAAIIHLGYVDQGVPGYVWPTP